MDTSVDGTEARKSAALNVGRELRKRWISGNPKNGLEYGIVTS